MELNSKNIGNELECWFSKSILSTNEIDFSDLGAFEKVLNIFIYDYHRYYPEQKTILLEQLKLRHELIGILLYRIARFYFEEEKENIAGLYSSLGTFLSGFEIYYSARIGRGLKINHGLGTVVGARTIIGDNALLHQCITIGDKNGGRPMLGNSVSVYAGAQIIGPIKVGNNVVIGANTVCFIDVPDNLKIAGVPARILSK